MAMHPRKWLCQLINRPFYSHCFVWGISITAAILPLITNNYGAAGPWCWIKLQPRPWGAIWMMVSFFGIIWTIILLNIFLYFQIRRKLHKILHATHRNQHGSNGSGRARANAKHGPPGPQDKLIEFHRQLIWYPIILIVAWIFPTMVRISQLVTNNERMSELPFGNTISVMFQLSSGMFVAGILNSVA